MKRSQVDDLPNMTTPVRPMVKMLVAATVLAMAFMVAGCRDATPQVTLIAWHDGLAEHPADVMLKDDRLWIAELFNNQLVYIDDPKPESLSIQSVSAFPGRIHAPHFFAEHRDEILVSEGWGSSVVRVTSSGDVNDVALGDQVVLKAPHGICSHDDWLYIADSLNSRVLRLRDRQPETIEVFADHARKVGYVRQLVCGPDGLYLANTYERRPEINPGQGSNVLRISDFDSGQVEVVTSFGKTNLTGLSLVGNRYLFVALWQKRRIQLHDTVTGDRLNVPIQMPPGRAGPPYGLYWDQEHSLLYAAFLGDIYHRRTPGGIAVFRLQGFGKGWFHRLTGL